MFVYYSLIIALACGTMLALCVLVQENGRIQKKDKGLLKLTFMLITISAFSEWLGCYLNSMTGGPRWLLMLVKCLDYTLTPLAGATLVIQMNVRNRWRDALVAVLAFNAVFQVVSCFTGWMVTVDESGHYTHGPLRWVYIPVYLTVLLILGVEFYLYGRRFSKQNRGSLYAILLLVFAGIAVQELSGSDYRTVYLSLALGAVLMYVHYTEYAQLRSDDFLRMQRMRIDTDPLTGLGSRSSYTHDLKTYDSAGALPDDLAAFMLDINGLKTVNDTLGHEAGDELISGAAACVTDVLGEHGSVYRTGGDEFVALVRLSPEAARKAVTRLDRRCAAWRGDLVKELRISTGCACAAEHPGLTCQQLVHEADQQMYEAKADYYRRSGRDRRRR